MVNFELVHRNLLYRVREGRISFVGIEIVSDVRFYGVGEGVTRRTGQSEDMYFSFGVCKNLVDGMLGVYRKRTEEKGEGSIKMMTSLIFFFKIKLTVVVIVSDKSEGNRLGA